MTRGHEGIVLFLFSVVQHLIDRYFLLETCAAQVLSQVINEQENRMKGGLLMIKQNF